MSSRVTLVVLCIRYVADVVASSETLQNLKGLPNDILSKIASRLISKNNLTPIALASLVNASTSGNLNFEPFSKSLTAKHLLEISRLDLSQATRLSTLNCVSIRDAESANAIAALLGRAQNLISLDLSISNWSEKQFELADPKKNFAQLTDMRDLRLSRLCLPTSITQCLSKFRHLETLLLSNCHDLLESGAPTAFVLSCLFSSS